MRILVLNRITRPTGQVVPVRAPAALARGREELIAIRLEATARLVLAARERIQERFGRASVVARYESLYRELVTDVQH